MFVPTAHWEWWKDYLIRRTSKPSSVSCFGCCSSLDIFQLKSTFLYGKKSQKVTAGAPHSHGIIDFHCKNTVIIRLWHTGEQDISNSGENIFLLSWKWEGAFDISCLYWRQTKGLWVWARVFVCFNVKSGGQQILYSSQFHSIKIFQPFCLVVFVSSILSPSSSSFTSHQHFGCSFFFFNPAASDRGLIFKLLSLVDCRPG